MGPDHPGPTLAVRMHVEPDRVLVFACFGATPVSDSMPPFPARGRLVFAGDALCWTAYPVGFPERIRWRRRPPVESLVLAWTEVAAVELAWTSPWRRWDLVVEKVDGTVVRFGEVRKRSVLDFFRASGCAPAWRWRPRPGYRI